MYNFKFIGASFIIYSLGYSYSIQFDFSFEHNFFLKLDLDQIFSPFLDIPIGLGQPIILGFKKDNNNYHL